MGFKWATVDKPLQVAEQLFIIRTWNVRMLYAMGKVKVLTNELEYYKIMITGRNDDTHAQVDIRIDNKGVEVIDSFCYSGTHI